LNTCLKPAMGKVEGEGCAGRERLEWEGAKARMWLGTAQC